MGARIEYTPNDNQFTIFAIDDIKITPGLCSHQSDFVYNFENGYEDLDIEKIRPLTMTTARLFSPRLSVSRLYPQYDHTRGTEEGYYFLFETDTFLTTRYYELSVSILNLRTDSNDPKCVRFAYQRTANVTFSAFVLPEDDFNYDYAHNNYSRVWNSDL